MGCGRLRRTAVGTSSDETVAAGSVAPLSGVQNRNPRSHNLLRIQGLTQGWHLLSEGVAEAEIELEAGVGFARIEGDGEIASQETQGGSCA